MPHRPPHRILMLIMAGVCLALICGCAAAAPRAARDSPPGSEAGGVSPVVALFHRLAGTQWHGIYLDDVRVGWGKTVRTTPSSWPSSGGRYQVRKEHQLRLLANGYAHRMTYRLDLEFASRPPHALERLVFCEEINDYARRLEMTKTLRGYRQTMVQDGARRERVVSAFDYTLEDELALEAWIGNKPPEGDFIQINCIDPDDFKKQGGFAKVVAVENRDVDGRPMPLYRIEHPAKGLGEVQSVYRQDLVLAGQKVSMGFELRHAAEDAARAPLPEVDLHVLLMLPIEVPLGRSDAVRRIALSVDPETGALLTQATGQRIERVPGGNGYRLTLAGADGYRQPVTAEENRRYSQVPSMLEANGDDILQDARKALDGSADVNAKIDRLLVFVDEAVEDSNQVLSPDLGYLLDRRKGDCSEHAALFEALARYFGIPCRKVTGLAYMGDWAQSFGLHAWNEVALDGYWKPVDPTRRAAELPPLYIRFPLDPEVNSTLSRSVPKMNIEVLEVDLFNRAGK